MTDDNKNAEITKVLTGGVRDNIKTILNKIRENIDDLRGKHRNNREVKRANIWQIRHHRNYIKKD